MRSCKLVWYKCLSFFVVANIYIILLNYILYILLYNKSIGILENYVTTRIIIFTSLIYLLVYVFLLWQWEGLLIGKRRILDLVFAHFITSLVVNIFVFVICWVFYLISVIQGIFLTVTLTLVQTIIGCSWVMFMHRIYEKMHFNKGTLFVYGSKDNPQEYIGMQSVIHKYFQISESICYFEGIEILKNKILQSKIVYLGDIPTQLRNELLKFCMKSKIEAYSFTKISDIYIHSAELRQLHDKILFEYPYIGIKQWEKAIKRMFDICISIVLLIGLSPVLLIVAFCIKLGDGGPIFYNQPRVTCNSQPFLMHKFRSMQVDAECTGARMACKNDSRVTNVGRVIRNLHIDELPQLINVLKGEMSLVGPRPERKEFIEEYSKEIPEFSERLKVQGGLTGYAQIYGRYNTSPEDKIKYDLYYIYNYSIWLDIKIFVLTIRILFQRENTEGVEEGQENALEKNRYQPIGYE